MPDKLYAYCNNCELARDKQSGFNVEEDELDSFCSDCGEELEILSDSEYQERVSETVDWPLTVAFDAPASLQGDHSYEIMNAAGTERLPFLGFDEGDDYYLDERVGNITMEITFNKNGEIIDKNVRD